MFNNGRTPKMSSRWVDPKRMEPVPFMRGAKAGESKRRDRPYASGRLGEEGPGPSSWMWSDSRSGGGLPGCRHWSKPANPYA